MQEIVTPRQQSAQKQTSSFLTSRLHIIPLPYRYFRATSTPKVEIPVCALSTTKGNCAIWSCRLSGLLHCRWLRGSELCSWKTTSPVSMSAIVRKGFSACSLFLLYPSAYSSAFMHHGSALPQQSLERFGVFPTRAIFEVALQGNVHPADLVMPQVFKESGVNLSGKSTFGFSGSRLFFPHHTKELTWTAAIYFSPCFVFFFNRTSSWWC